MSTSGGGLLNALLYVVVLVLGVRVGVRWLPAQRRRAGLVVAVAVWLVVAVPSLLQIPFPALLTHLERDPALVRRGQVWRVLTGLVVQDGGIGGTVFNLVALAVVALVAGQLWGRGLPLVFLATHLGFAVPAVFVSDDVGAGNSGATFGLAASMAGWALVGPHRERGDLARLAGILGAGVVLLALRDAHGIPVLAGPAIGSAARMWQTQAHHDDG